MKSLLFVLDPDRRVSPFDVTMAYDAGFDVVIPYENVTARDARFLVEDALFSRNPKNLKNTCFFVGGRDVVKAGEILKACRDAMFGPFKSSVIIDPSGANTTAVAMVARVEDAMNNHGFGDLKGKNCAVFGTGPVGVTVAEILSTLDCRVAVVEPNPMLSAEYLLEQEAVRGVLGRHGAFVHGIFAATSNEKLKALEKADLVFCCAARGVRIIDMDLLKQLRPKKVMMDTNAVAPHGIEGLIPNDYMKEIVPGIYGIGALVIGDMKFKLQREVLIKARESTKARVFDYGFALELAREMLKAAPTVTAEGKIKTK